MWQPTHVQVTVQRARGLNFKGKNDTNDAFVVISLGKEKFQTSVKEKATNPVEWHEECELSIPTHGNTAAVQLTVYHRNGLGLDEFLGQIQLPLNEYDVYERPKNRWHRLKGKPEKDKKKGEKERGELEARIAFTVKSGSLSDVSKKEKEKLKTSLTSLKHLGGSLMSLGTKEKQGLKKFAKSVSHKIDKVAKKPRFKGRKSSQDSQGFPQEHLPSKQQYGDADPGVISDSDDEKFGFDEEVQVATGSSSPYSTVSRGSSYIHEEEPEQGGDFFRRNNSLPIGPSSKPPPKPARLGSDLFGKGAVSEVTPVNSEPYLPPLPPSPRTPPSRTPPSRPPRPRPRSPLPSPSLPTDPPLVPEPDNLSSSPNTLTFSNLTPIDLTSPPGRARESVPPSFPPPPVPEDVSPPVSFVTLESHAPKEPQDQKLAVKDEPATLSPSSGFSSNSGSSGFFGEDSISQALNQSDPKVDEISLSSSVSSKPEPDLSFEKEFIEIPTKQEKEFIEIPTKQEIEFKIPTKEEKEFIEISAKEEKEFIEIPTKQEENFIELPTKQDSNSAISALEDKDRSPEKSSDEAPTPSPRKEKPPNLSLKCTLTPTSSLSTFDSFHSIQSSSSNSHLGSALAAASISYLTPLVPSSPAVVPPPSPSIMSPSSNVFAPTSPSVPPPVPEVPPPVSEIPPPVPDVPPPIPAIPPPTTSSPTATSFFSTSSPSQTLSPSPISPPSNTVPATSASLTPSVPPTPVVVTSTTTTPITPSLPPTPVTTSTPAPSIGSKPSTAVVRSGSLHEKRSSEPSIDEWERKLYGRNAFVGSAENVNRVESRNNSLNTSQASSTQDIADPSTPTSRFPEIKALTLEGRGKEEEDNDTKDGKEKKKRGKKEGFKGKFFRGGGSRERLGEEDGRVVEGGNDKLPLAPMQRQSRLPQEIHEKFSGKTREDLLEMIVGLQANVEKQAKHTRDLEDYIDDLLLRVMEATPQILQAPICRSKEIKTTEDIPVAFNVNCKFL